MLLFNKFNRPDLAALQSRGAIPTTIPPPLAAFTGPNLEDLEAPRRQTSMDGEAIKIVIHDVDSGPICSSKRRIVLRKDPSDKAHRSKFFKRIKKKNHKLSFPCVWKSFTFV